jgi:hypothetical protein
MSFLILGVFKAQSAENYLTGAGGLFQRGLVSEIPVGEVAPFFPDGFGGRPAKELSTLLGTLVLQQTHDLTDQ